MRRKSICTAALLVAAGTGVTALPSTAVTAPTTSVTTPASSAFVTWNPAAASTSMTVKGSASASVSNVDFRCFYDNDANDVTMGSASVASGAFTGPIDLKLAPKRGCILRAVPAGYTGDSVDGFTGPKLYASERSFEKTGSTTYGYFFSNAQRSGYVDYEAANEGGVWDATPADDLSMMVGPVLSNTDSPYLFYENGALYYEAMDPAHPGSEITVDGHPGYMPYAVKQYLVGHQGISGLTVPPLKLTLGTRSSANGNWSWTESSPIFVCSTDVYPPTSGSCPGISASGVTFSRTTTQFRDGRQVKVQDTFTNTSGDTHVVHLEYQQYFDGDLGLKYLWPGKSRYVTPTTGTTLTGLAAGTRTIFVSGETYGGVTYSAAPGSIFVQKPLGWGMRYSRTIPPGKKAFLRLTYSQDFVLSGVQKLATLAQHEMAGGIVISFPAAGGHVAKTFTVSGTVTAGANGMPSTVKVNGVAATYNTSTGTFHKSLTLAAGKRTFKVTATDPYGVIWSKTRTVNVG